MSESAKPTKKCVVLVPPSTTDDPESWTRAFRWAIKPALEKTTYEIIRTDELPELSARTPTTIRHLFDSDIAIADITNLNPDVLYQVGIRHAAGEHLIAIAQENGAPPNLLRDVPIIYYGDATHPDVLERLEEKIIEKIRFIESSPDEFDSPVTQAIKAALDSRKVREYEEAFDRLEEQQGDLSEQIRQLSVLQKSIAEYTRKPLTGIAEIFYILNRTLASAHPSSRIWYVGMTLGFGPPHRFRRLKRTDGTVVDIGDELRELWPETPGFDDLIGDFTTTMAKIVESAPQAIIVTLQQDAEVLKRSFLGPLASRGAYASLEASLDPVAEEVKERHDMVAGHVRPNCPVHHLPSLPFQLLIVEKAVTGHPSLTKRACLVFHIGTENIGSARMDASGELGFYTEIENSVRMFATMAESLYYGEVGSVPD